MINPFLRDIVPSPCRCHDIVGDVVYLIDDENDTVGDDLVVELVGLLGWGCEWGVDMWRVVCA